MGLIKTLWGVVHYRKPVAPFQVTSNIAPQENYAGYTMLPNLPMSNGDYDPNPYRLHAPFQVERDTKRLTTNAGVVMFDPADENIIGIPDSSLQQYFNEKKVIEAQVVLAPAHGVVVPTASYQTGWQQSFVPSEGMRSTMSGGAPQVLLSNPIQVTTFVDEGTRTPITGAKAHPTKRGH